MIDTLLSKLAPHSCCGCSSKGSILCEFCKNDIISEPYEGCFVCLQPAAHGNLCTTCSIRLSARDGWCVGVRRGTLKHLLDRYKFDAAREAGSVAAMLLDARLPVLPGDIVVTTVPTVASNRRTRGFDHMASIARRFAQQRKLSYRATLQRSDNRAQHLKSRQERLRFDASTLSVKDPVPAKVLLIDDIYTTGVTLRTCIERLGLAGAIEVYVAIIARQPLDERDDL